MIVPQDEVLSDAPHKETTSDQINTLDLVTVDAAREDASRAASEIIAGPVAVENIHPTEVCTDCVFEVSPITNPTGLTSLRTRPLPSL